MTDKKKEKTRVMQILVITLSCLFVLFGGVIFASCKTYYWEMAQSVHNVSKIEIVEIENEELKSTYCEIDSAYYEEVYNDVQTMPANKYFGSPTTPRGRVIKITFIDGAYDIISEYEPKHILDPKDGLDSGKVRITRYCYDSTEFAQLIDKWINVCSAQPKG